MAKLIFFDQDSDNISVQSGSNKVSILFFYLNMRPLFLAFPHYMVAKPYEYLKSNNSLFKTQKKLIFRLITLKEKIKHI